MFYLLLIRLIRNIQRWLKNEKYKEQKINLYIGLTTNKNKKLNLKNTLKVISNIFIKYKINGFSVNRIFGFWNNKEKKP